MKYWLGCIMVFFCVVQLGNAQTISYTSHVRPLFVSYGCTGCHPSSGGGLNLGTYATVFTTGTHAPVVVKNDTNSILVQKLKGIAPFGAQMPFGGDPVSVEDLATIVAWIRGGAPENTTSVDENDVSPFVKTFDLKQNYPNPFNPSTKIQFSIPASGYVRLTVFDGLGKEVAVLVDRSMSAGSYTVAFDAANLPTGVYFYRLNAGGNRSTKKLLLTK